MMVTVPSSLAKAPRYRAEHASLATCETTRLRENKSKTQNYKSPWSLPVSTELPLLPAPQELVKKRSNIVILHGRIVPQPVDDKYYVPPSSPLSQKRSNTQSCSEESSSAVLLPSTPVPTPFIQQKLWTERQTKLFQLQEDMKQYENTVSTLATLLRQRHGPSGDGRGTVSYHRVDVEMRIRVLIQSAQELDQTMRDKVVAYEKTMPRSSSSNSSNSLNKNSASVTATIVKSRRHYYEEISDGDRLRTDQMESMKLHRTFKRIHKSLFMCLRTVETAPVRIRSLGSIGQTRSPDISPSPSSDTVPLQKLPSSPPHIPYRAPPPPQPQEEEEDIVFPTLPTMPPPQLPSLSAPLPSLVTPRASTSVQSQNNMLDELDMLVEESSMPAKREGQLESSSSSSSGPVEDIAFASAEDTRSNWCGVEMTAASSADHCGCGSDVSPLDTPSTTSNNTDTAAGEKNGDYHLFRSIQKDVQSIKRGLAEFGLAFGCGELSTTTTTPGGRPDYSVAS